MTNDCENYEERIVAFIDILGFKNLVNKPEQFKLIKDTLSYFKAWDNSGKYQNKWDEKIVVTKCNIPKTDWYLYNLDNNDVVCTSVSDSIIVSMLYDEKRFYETLSTFLVNIALIAHQILLSGLLLRGAITAGKLYHKENGILFGQPYIDAWNYEEKLAVYPRIILSQDLFMKSQALSSPANQYPFYRLLTRFADGFVGFHQLRYLKLLESYNSLDCTYEHQLEQIRDFIIKNLNRSVDDPNVFGKYKWLMDEYNNMNMSVLKTISDIQNADIYYR
jgi:hypothetical protein